MNNIQNLFTLIRDYQNAVRTAVTLLEASGIARPTSSTAWVGVDIPEIGELSGGVPYFKHGFGCAVYLPSGKVDFDFGDEGQIDGFTCNRLLGFVNGQVARYGLASVQAFEATFQAAVQTGDIVPSGYILCYLRNDFV
ncbi:MAG: hypothetical protein HY774_29785 [Acidobacteria bacterium]|nr:hypothetical protein [Acidobacteriota bacterium]